MYVCRYILSNRKTKQNNGKASSKNKTSKAKI